MSTKDLEIYDLTHRWGHGMPQWPSRANLNVRVVEFHAKDGLLVQQFEGIMHRGTHMDAPIHVQENQPTLTGYPLWRFFGTGVVVSIPKKKWGVVTPKDLDQAEPKIRKGDILMINTGSHLNYGDNPDYFASWGACSLEFCEADDAGKLSLLFRQFHSMVLHDGVEPEKVHTAFLVIPEYRQALIEMGLGSLIPGDLRDE